MAILCTTHFSDRATLAATGAAELARARGEPLLLVHVLSESLARAGGDSLRAAMRSVLQTEADRLTRLGAKVEPIMLDGSLADVTSQLAKHRDVSLIVAGGNRSETPFGGLGGHLDRLADQCECPLLVVRSAEPFRAWVRGERPLKVLVGVDRTSSFGAVRKWIGGLRALGPIELVAAHIFSPFEESARLGLPSPYVFDEIPPAIQEALSKEILARLQEGPEEPPTRVVLHPSIGRQADPLVTLASQEKADLIVVGTHHRRGVAKLWSVSHHTLRLAPMSVATIPTGTAVESHLPARSFQRVLVTTDLSPLANAALPYALAMTAPGGVVHLLYVTGSRTSPEERQDLELQLRELLPAEQRMGREVTCEVLVGGEEPTLIHQTAERLNVDALCMSSHGRSALATTLFGSVTGAVLKLTHRPLLLVRPQGG